MTSTSWRNARLLQFLYTHNIWLPNPIWNTEKHFARFAAICYLVVQICPHGQRFSVEMCNNIYILNPKLVTSVSYIFYDIFLVVLRPNVGHGLLSIEVSRSHMMTLVGLLWTCDQLVAKTSTWQHTTLTIDKPALGGIRTPNLSRRAAIDLRLKTDGHWDRQILWFSFIY
jgi:hypothetical protein